MRKSKDWLSRRQIMCLSVATDLHTGERAKTGCLGGR